MPKEEPIINNDEILDETITSKILDYNDEIELITKPNEKKEDVENNEDDNNENEDEKYVENIYYILKKFEEYSRKNNIEIGKYITYRDMDGLVGGELS